MPPDTAKQSVVDNLIGTFLKDLYIWQGIGLAKL